MYLQDLYNAAVLAKESTENAVRLQLEADRIKAREVLLADQRKMEEFVAAEERQGNIKKTNIVERAWTTLTSWISGKLSS